MSITPCLFGKWSEDNNSIVRKWKEFEKRRQPNRDLNKQCYTELLRLQKKIQGLPAAAEQLRLEVTVSYNALLFSLSFSKSNETQDNLTHSLVRALEAVGARGACSDPATLWQHVLKALGGTEFVPWIEKLLLIQWTIWLSESHLEGTLHLLQQIHSTNKTSSAGDLLAEIRHLTFSVQEDASLLVAVAAKDLKDLLLICTFISKGVELMKEENYAEALLAFQEASILPSPRAALAHVHTLTGLSFTKLGRPQSALQCYRKALEVDFSCHRALYQSSLVYRQLGNSHAEIEALLLLHSAVLLRSERDSSRPPPPLISLDRLLGSEKMASISQTPSPLLILHTLAHRCVHSDRNSEAAEFYLDLLACLQSDARPCVSTSDDLPFPRIPVVYLEAAFAMLKAQRSWDVLAICDEVIAKTADLVPERLLLEPCDRLGHTTMNLESDPVGDKLDCVLWSGAAYFLQGHAHLQLKDTKEALSSFTRAINQLVKVFVKQEDWTVHTPGEAADHKNKVRTLEVLKGQTLGGRGLCFAERGQLKEALRDFQLSLQSSPGGRNTQMWLVEILWRLDRKEEAAAVWKQTSSSSDSVTLVDLPLYLQAWKEDAMHLDHSSLNKKLEDFTCSCDVKTQT
ncbi:Fanconi anemia group G protein homolog isoform X1 [Hoplias malabaricus]|uniref:Fanconi anemia group G protein homolog isoform X1 n=1 Tax=Hoplias malabaricus TaxID=27720 RepID=UPI003462F4A6